MHVRVNHDKCVKCCLTKNDLDPSNVPIYCEKGIHYDNLLNLPCGKNWISDSMKCETLISDTDEQFLNDLMCNHKFL